MPEICEKDLAKLSIEIWRLQKKIKKISNNPKDISSLDFSYRQLINYLCNMGVTFEDFQGQAYDAGLAVEVIENTTSNISKDSNPIILETIEPALFINNRLLKIGKVIIGSQVPENKNGEE
jgi:hypothetical protein